MKAAQDSDTAVTPQGATLQETTLQQDQCVPDSDTPCLLSEPNQYRDTLLTLLRSANDEILLEFYILEEDEFGDTLLDTLLDAAARGVKVRLIVDGFGSQAWLERKDETLRQSSLQTRIYHPMPWSALGLRQLLSLPRDFLRHLLTLNRRDHRKLVLVDQRHALIGSHNVFNASLLWHEASLVLHAEMATVLRESFERVWWRTVDLNGKAWSLHKRISDRKASKSAAPGKHGIHDNTSLKRSRTRNRAILQLIAGAQQRLWITTPYLCPHRTLLKLIKARAEAGVDVRLILPRQSDVRFSRWIAQSLYRELLQSGVTIHEYTPGILHAKVMVADDRFLLGSSNFNHRSFLQDLEVDHLGEDALLLDAIVRWKHATLAQCEDIKAVAQVPLHTLKCCLVRVLNPLKVYF